MAGDAVDETGHMPEDGRLHTDLAAAKEHLAATNEVLTALGRSASDLDAMLDTVVRSARRLCRADVAQIHLVDGEVYRLADSIGSSDEFLAHIHDHPVEFDRRTLIGRVGLDRRAQQIVDVLADSGYGRLDAQRIAGYRTIMGAPMLLDGEVVGVLSVWRTKVDPFDDKATTLLTAFAAQSAIATRNVDLVRALEARGVELARKVEQLEALRRVGEAVSSSLDLEEVLATIVTQAVHLSGADGGSLLEFDDDDQEFRVRTAYGTSDRLLETLRQTRIGLTETLVGRAALAGSPLQAPDLETARVDPHLQRLREAGWRSVVAAPMLREGRIVGALVARRRKPGGFSDETCDLLQTFASQSALAVLNARLFQELERKSAELEVASRHKSEFLASMSHELRTPLNAVIGFSEVLLERMFGDLNERQEEYLRDIWSSGRHLLELLNDILDLSKVEAGRMDLEPSIFSVREALEYGLALTRERATQHQVAVTLEVAPDVGVLEADELRFKQVVLNLLSNAVKFTAAGGSVVVQAFRRGEELHVTVRDTGVGVAPEDQDRIFESFQQGARSTSRQEGTGLGLTLSKRIVELFGGRMWLESRVGVGSTFGFSVPITPAAGTDEAAEPAAGDGPLVVVIEDDRRSLELATLFLEGAGLHVVGVREGREGLETVRRLRPAVVVLDIRIPGLDGWDVLASLKHDPDTAPIPVIVMSIVDERGRGFALGAAEYLVKPVGREELLSALRRTGVLSDAGRTLLVIDDDPAVRELITAVMASSGWTVLSAESGEKGLVLARQAQPSVVLLDLLMPDMDGFAVTEALREDPVTRDLPIVVLTAKAMTASDKKRLQGRVASVADKGDFSAAGLVDLVRKASDVQMSSGSSTS
jgi:signal transduction histidine kinase/DNA-binding response OmpR family regulator